MQNLFDKIQKQSFDATLKVFGYEARWQPENKSKMQCANVHYKEPSQEWEIAEVEYLPNNYLMEYQMQYFTGLCESVNEGNTEHVEIYVIDDKTGKYHWVQYYVRKVKRVFDGNTFRATLQLV